MFRTTRTTRTTSRIVAAGVVGATLALAAPIAAEAQTQSVIVSPGSTICIKQNATYQYRATVNAGAPVGSSVTRNGILVAFQFPATAVAYEGRSSTGTFPGTGVYKLCATNSGSSNTRVTLTLLSDFEF
jgi:hypothetical protein